MDQKSEIGGRKRVYSAESVRQGEIVLRKPWQRIVFIAGLVAPLVLLIVWLIASRMN